MNESLIGPFLLISYAVMTMLCAVIIARVTVRLLAVKVSSKRKWLALGSLITIFIASGTLSICIVSSYLKEAINTDDLLLLVFAIQASTIFLFGLIGWKTFKNY